MRRFFRSPRLILTVATIGLAQLLAFASLMMPRLWGEDLLNTRIDAPFDWRMDLAPLVFGSGYLVAWVLALLAVAAVAAFLRHPRRHRRAGGRRPGGPRRCSASLSGASTRWCGWWPPCCRSSPCSCRRGSSASRWAHRSGSRSC